MSIGITYFAYGKILNGAFVNPLGYKNGFVVAVESPSSLTN
jgi:hypothetical protein